MEQRDAPPEYALKAMAAFERSGWLPIIVSVIVCVAISAVWRDTPFWLFGVIMVGGFMVSAFLSVWMEPKFCCPECGREINTGMPNEVNHSGAVSLVCWNCRIEWNMGYSEGCD